MATRIDRHPKEAGRQDDGNAVMSTKMNVINPNANSVNYDLLGQKLDGFLYRIDAKVFCDNHWQPI